MVPNQYVGFQILPGGNYLVANWLGHSGEVMGVQLLEYDSEGALVWSYRPDPMTESLSLHHVIVLDHLDTSQLYVDDTTGCWCPCRRHESASALPIGRRADGGGVRGLLAHGRDQPG